MPICSRHGVGYDEGAACPRCAAGVPAAGADSWFPWACLTVGQVASLVGCAAAVVVAVWGLSQVTLGGGEPAPPRTGSPPPTAGDAGWVRLAGGLVGFFYSAGLWFVFARAKRTGGE